jgi:SAM-dependent methyltransferase
MTDSSTHNPFDEAYFHTGPYAQVAFHKKYTQYWWSNRFYAILAQRNAKPSPNKGQAARPAILEIGCGLGHLLAWLAPHFEVTGTDINEWAISQARQVVPSGRFELCPAEDLSPFADAAFQVVIAKHVVEHLPNPAPAIAEMSRVLSPGGLLVLATPNFDSPMRAWKKERWIGFQDKTHVSLLSPAQWLALLKDHNLHPHKVFSDGFWDAPYLPLIPAKLQKLFFGAPGGLQAMIGWGFLPLWAGESLIVLAYKS